MNKTRAADLIGKLNAARLDPANAGQAEAMWERMGLLSEKYGVKLPAKDAPLEDTSEDYTVIGRGHWRSADSTRDNPFARDDPKWHADQSFQDWIHGMRADGWYVRVRHWEEDIVDERWSGDYENFYSYGYDDRGDGNTRNR